MFAMLEWQLFVSNAFVGCYSSAPSLKMDKKNTTACRVPLHDTMPSFMNFRRVLDLLEFKNQVYIAMFCRQSIVPWCLKFIPISCMGPKHAPKETDLIFQPIYMHWSMCIISNLNYAHKMPRKPS